MRLGGRRGDRARADWRRAAAPGRRPRRYLQTDDTPVTILEETGSRKGRIWTYLDPLGRQVVFDATPTHERDGPEALLAAFAGDLQADAYTGYDALYRTGRIRELGCWAHARRGFVEALPTDARAAPMVALIQQLYQVERADRGRDRRDPARPPAGRRACRCWQQIAAERDALGGRRAAEVAARRRRALPDESVGRPAALRRGRPLPDRQQRRRESAPHGVAVGRKNWLFAGSFEGARRAALLYSLVQSCTLIDVSPFDYLKDVLLRVATHPQRLHRATHAHRLGRDLRQRAAA